MTANGKLADIATATERFELVLRDRRLLERRLSSKLSCQERVTANNFHLSCNLSRLLPIHLTLPFAADRQDWPPIMSGGATTGMVGGHFFRAGGQRSRRAVGNECETMTNRRAAHSEIFL